MEMPDLTPLATTCLLNPPRPAATAGGKKSLTVCHVVHSLNVGGAEVLAANLARRMQDRVHVLLACLDELGPLGEQLRREGFRVIVLGRRQGVDWGCMRRLASLCRDEQVQLLHAHQYTPFFYAVSSQFFRRRPPVLFTEHGRWFPDYPRTKRIVFNRLMLRSRDRVVGVGQSVRQALIDNEGIRPDRVGVIYNGINIAQFAHGESSSATRLQIRRELGVEAHDLLLVQVARLDALKDHLTAVRTLERVRQFRPDVKLLLAGEGPEHPAIDQEVRRRKLESQVRFLGLRADVQRLLHAADIFLLTSISEGIPLTVIEAMAAGLPVVATRVGGVPEIVEEGQTGWLAPARDDEQLAAAIQRLAENAPLRKQMGAAGRLRANALFSDEQWCAAYTKLYVEMLHG
jgi:L-malate glycosyltransferase